MDTYSQRREKIEQIQRSSQGYHGLWEKVISKTSRDGFTHGNPHPHSPMKKAANTNGNWKQFMNRSDQKSNEGKRIQKSKESDDHFQVNSGMVALLDENDLFNSRSLQRINKKVKESHVFDAVTKQYSTNMITKKDSQTWCDRFRSDYTKYYHTGYICPLSSIGKDELSHMSSSSICPSSYLAIAQAKKLRASNKLECLLSPRDSPVIPSNNIIQPNVLLQSNKGMKKYGSSGSLVMSPQRETIRNNIYPNQNTEMIADTSEQKRMESSYITKTEEASQDFDKKKRVRRPLPTSDIQKKFQEYKKKYDFIQLG